MSDYINRDLKESDFKDSDYINRDFAIYAFRRNSGYLDGNLFATDEAIVYLKALPSADVVERKRGKWIKKKHYRICPFCEATMIDSGFDDFCPHCGADMRGKQ